MIDAVTYLRERERMCDAFHGVCKACPFAILVDADCDMGTFCNGYAEPDNPEESVNVVETWSKMNPIMTNEDKFKEVFGQPPYPVFGIRCEWWNEEYHEPEEYSLFSLDGDVDVDCDEDAEQPIAHVEYSPAECGREK